MIASVATKPQHGGRARPQGVVAYVADADSEATLRRVASHMALPDFELRRGDLRNAERDLKKERSPAVLFVDASEIDMVLDAMHRLSDVCEPQIEVVVIGARNDVGLYRELLALGAADYLFKPLTAELVENVLARLTNKEGRGGDARLGKLVAITGARGGVGTSSLAANVGHYLAEKASRRVILVDGDTRAGALALLTGATPNAGLADALESPSRIDDLFLERAKITLGDRLDLLASEVPFGRARALATDAYDVLLPRLRQTYHYVIVDVPEPVRDAFHPLIVAANLHIVVTEATLLAARDVGRMFEHSGSAQRTMLVHNKGGRPGDLDVADFEAATRRRPDLTVPYNPRVFGGAVNLGRLAWTTDPKIESAIAQLAREFSGQGATSTPQPLIRRLLANFG